jgi:cbb3-type cytochrome c oxidase CcoQ subunit
MNYEQIEPILQYLYLAGLGFSLYALYSYMWYMYSNDKKGNTDYEKFSSLALDDSIDSKPLNENK